MHEMSITRNILSIIRREMKKSGLKRLRSVKLRIGELTAIDNASLRFCFEASIAGSPLEGALLEIEDVPLAGRCKACATGWRITDLSFRCPSCGSIDIEKTSGTELDIISIEAV